jgi:hypothetical protein
MARAPLILAALLVPACDEQKQEAVAARPAPAAAALDKAALATAEKLVRAKLVNPDAARFARAASYDNDGAEIVCGTFDHIDPDGTAVTGQRYIAVGGEQSFVEAEMREGEMDKAVAQFCRDA